MPAWFLKLRIINSGISVYGDRTDNKRELKNHDGVHDDDVCWLRKDWNENVSFGGEKNSGKRKLKMQSVGRSTTTLNVNTNVNCDVRSQQSFWQWRLLKQWKSYFLSRASNFMDDGEFFVLSDLYECTKHLLSVQRLFNFRPAWDDRVRVPVRV